MASDCGHFLEACFSGPTMPVLDVAGFSKGRDPPHPAGGCGAIGPESPVWPAGIGMCTRV